MSLGSLGGLIVRRCDFLRLEDDPEDRLRAKVS